MADNIIQKIIRLILDEKSAKQTQDGANAVTASIEANWKSAAKKIAGYLGVAFLTTKMIEFGAEAVKQASVSEDAWSELAGSIDAVGGSFDKMETKLRAAGEAFQSATIHDNDAYATSLSRLVALTGDVGASTNNMGLVANVAAKFFKGDLAPATDLVAKAMNGNVTALQKMGIHVQGAQEALDVLASRSFGAAEKKAQTFSGQMAQLNNAWEDFEKDLGNAIINSGGASSALDVLRAAVGTLTDWVDENKGAIGEWVTKGVAFAIDAADVFIRAVVGMGNILSGGFRTSLGLAAKGLGLLTNAIAFSVEGWGKLLTLMGAEDKGKALEDFSAKIYASAEAIDTWAEAAMKAGSDQVAKGIDRLATPLFSSDDFKAGRKHPAATPLAAPAPMIGMNAVLSDSEKAWAKFDSAIDTAKKTITGTTKELDYLEAQAAAVRDLMKDLTTAGVKPTDDAMRFLTQALRDTNEQIEIAKKAAAQTQDWKDFADETEAATRTAAAFGDKLHDLQGESQRLTKAIGALIKDGIDPHDEKLQGLIARLKEVQGAIESETSAMQFQQQVAGDLAQALFASFGGGLGPYARMKAKQNYLEATEDGIRAVLAALTGFGALHAGKYAAAAAQHAALGAAWSALASSVGGPSGGSAPISTSATVTNPGSDLGTARTATGTSSRAAGQPEAVTEIHFVGPGFDALNPRVQKVVRGAQQEGTERAGTNGRVRVIRSS